MEKDLLKDLRDKYRLQINELISKKNLLCKLFHQKETYEDNPIIQMYLLLNANIESLKKEIEDKEKYIKEKAIAQYTEIYTNSSQENGRLFVYVDDIYDENGNSCSYYFDAISGLSKEVLISDVEEFEKKNNVIDLISYVNNSKASFRDFDCQGSDLFINDVIKIIQKDFIINALESGQSNALYRMLSKGKKQKL